MKERDTNAEAEEWLELSLEQACGKPIVYGIVQAGPNCPGGVPYIRSTDVGQPLDAASLLRTTPEIAEKYRRSTVSAGDIVFSLRGNIGEMSIVPAELEGANLTQGTARISSSSVVLGEFLFYALQTEAVQRSLYSVAKGSALQEVTLNDLRLISVLIPQSRILQRYIAEALGNWDRAIQLLESSIKQRARLRWGFMQKLLTGKRRPQALGAKWSTITLAEFFEEFSEPNRDRRVQLPLSCSKLYGVIPQAERFEKRMASADLSRYQVVRRNNLVYDPMLLWDASIGFVETVDEGVISPAYNCFRFKGDAMERSWFRYLFQTHYMKHQYKVISQGTNTRRKKAPAGAFLGITIEMPTDAREIKQVVAFLEKADREIALLKKLLAAYRQQKKGLMQQLLTGKPCVHAPLTSRAAG
ncbi:restriction endonuclease subunit S [Pyxidicoccus sp. MSG2]|uniref:restriction endonuclease subunit S n=1 Tax=Pyxidicoccus sp. MSG2 TaxID=2996790 RepID=UPI002270722A|nr:restriction endonuclease subunit S [Pyxidicoccus sp. MSG2]MCY1019690.1 restriction endonuclease subunit S [Pyxidicoccus sp. MSG2]